MSLQIIVDEIKKIKPLADEEVLEQPRETLSGRLARQRQAKDRLKTLTENYARQLVGSSAFILVTGPTAETFCQQAVEKFDCFSAQADTFFEDLAGRVASVLYANKESSANLFEVVSRHLEDKALELGILGYPQLVFKQQYRRTLKDKADLVVLLKQAISEQVGTELIGIQACRAIVPQAIERSHVAKITPVVISINEQDLEAAKVGLRRLTKHVVAIYTGEESSEEDVEGLMLQVRAQITGRQVVFERPTVKAEMEAQPATEENEGPQVEEVSPEQAVAEVHAEKSQSSNKRNRNKKNN